MHRIGQKIYNDVMQGLKNLYVLSTYRSFVLIGYVHKNHIYYNLIRSLLEYCIDVYQLQFISFLMIYYDIYLVVGRVWTDTVPIEGRLQLLFNKPSSSTYINTKKNSFFYYFFLSKKRCGNKGKSFTVYFIATSCT